MFFEISLFIGNARIENSELNMLLKSEVIVLIFELQLFTTKPSSPTSKSKIEEGPPTTYYHPITFSSTPSSSHFTTSYNTPSSPSFCSPSSPSL